MRSGALNGKTYNPVIDSQGKAVSGYEGWTQVVSVHPVDPNRITLEITDSSPELAAPLSQRDA